VQVAEELLLADRAALAAEDPATMRVVAAKRRLVELSIRCATKVRVGIFFYSNVKEELVQYRHFLQCMEIF
jgi:hypothetical protein